MTELSPPLASPQPYNLDKWGAGYFSASEDGALLVHPDGPGTAAIDLKAVVDHLRTADRRPPLLIRFPEILEARIAALHQAFAGAIAEMEYLGSYQGVYPIKVNQERHLVEHVLKFAGPYRFGLEAGSKPELLAAMALLDDPQALLICNGYKDPDYVETALFASRLGRRTVLVAEKPSELALIRDCAARLGIAPVLGLRARLASPGSGRWEASSGERSKFGFSVSDLLAALDYLREAGLLEGLKLLHFHLGSQISSIRAFQDALAEASWIYASLVELGAPLTFFDVGGGLGIDYTGDQTSSPSSMNYTLEEYARTVVAGVMEICDRAGVPHPVLVSESGRATAAHHSVLVIEVLASSGGQAARRPRKPPAKAALALHNLHWAYRTATPKNLLESYHDAVAARDECLTLFRLGHLPLAERGAAEQLFQAVCHKILRLARRRRRVPPEIQGLEQKLAETFLCNFSLFQSLPDCWAVDQLFPVLPIHRLDEEPLVQAVLADLTCDSDGKLESFIGPEELNPTVALPPFDGEPYYLGVFLVGAYQEILGDLHNLFGDTHIVDVWRRPGGGFSIEHVIPGDRVRDVLRYVRYDPDGLAHRLERAAAAAVAAGRLDPVEAESLLARYRFDLDGYTYLEP